jgi:hypothetical protein
MRTQPGMGRLQQEYLDAMAEELAEDPEPDPHAGIPEADLSEEERRQAAKEHARRLRRR